MDDVSAPAPSPWQATRFEVRTRLEPLDYLHLMGAVRWNGVERCVAWLAAVGISGLGAVAALLLSDPFTKNLPDYPYWDWGIAFALAGALVAFLIYKVFVMGPYVESTFEGQPIGMGESVIVADTKGVAATSAGIEVRIPWDKVQAVVVTNEHLFVMFGRLVGVIVPRRAFTDDGEAQRFAEFVRSRAQKVS
jgi:YcxB-like protein